MDEHFDLAWAQRELARNGRAIEALVDGVGEAQARWRPDPESWSLLEVICHLGDEEREDFRQRIDYLLHRPGEDFPPIDPQGWVTDRGYNERVLGAMVEAFTVERERSLAWLDGLANADWSAAAEHPAAGRFTAADMLAAWVTHDHLHLRQLIELKRAYFEKIAAGRRHGYAGDW